MGIRPARLSSAAPRPEIRRVLAEYLRSPEANPYRHLRGGWSDRADRAGRLDAGQVVDIQSSDLWRALKAAGLPNGHVSREANVYLRVHQDGRLTQIPPPWQRAEQDRL